MPDGNPPPPPPPLYWVLQLGGWSLWGLTSLLVGAPPGLMAAITTAAVLSTHASRHVIHRRSWHSLSPPRVLLRVAPLSLACGLAMLAAAAPWSIGTIAGTDAIAYYLSFAGICLGWFVAYFALHYWTRTRAAEREKWRLELAARDAELAAMRAQINPHFLFNSLSSLRRLIDEDPERAKRAVNDLGALLRYTLRLSERPTVSLGEEMKAVRHYLDLEQIRFESRVSIEVGLPRALLSRRVPPMLLQTLAENAVQHGIATRSEAGFIRIEGEDRAGETVLRVINSGTIRHETESTGIGLANAAERLRLSFGPRARIRVAPAGDEVVAEVRLPPGRSREPEAAANRDPEPTLSHAE